MADKETGPEKPLVEQTGPMVFVFRNEQVMLDADVARHFGTETKRVNEAVTRNRAKFNEEHSFKLEPEEHDALRSQLATSKGGRGGLRYAPRVFTLKGVARLATVLTTDEALRATDLIIETFISVYQQLNAGKTKIAVSEPSAFEVTDQDVGAIKKFKRKLVGALTKMVDTMTEIQNNPAFREKGSDFGSRAVESAKEHLKTKGLENAKLQAEAVLLLAQAEKTLAETQKAQAETNTINLDNLERSINLVKNLMEMSRELEPAEFVSLLDNYQIDPPAKKPKQISKKSRNKKAKGED